MTEAGAMSQGSWEQLGRQASHPRETGPGAEAPRQLLTFSVGETPYAVPVESVREIVRIRPITPIPRVTRDIRGVISLRGEIIQVVDLRVRLRLPETHSTRASRIIVVHLDDGRLAGILVDAVREVLRVSGDAIGPSSGGEGGIVHSLCARGEEFVSLVDLDKVLEVDDGD